MGRNNSSGYHRFDYFDPSISAEAMAYRIGVSSRAVEKQIAKLRTMGILTREGTTFGGYWRIIMKP